MAACIPSLLLLYPFLISTTEQSSLPIVTVVIFFGLFVSLNSKNTWNSCAHLTWLANKFLVSLLNFHFLRTHLYREKSHLLLWRRGCCLCCRLQLLWNPFSMFVGTAMLWSKFPHNLCLLRQDEIVSTWVGNARMNTPKLRMASTSHLLLVSAWVLLSTSEQLKHIRLCIACNIHGLSRVFVKHKNHVFATVCWNKVRPSS